MAVAVAVAVGLGTAAGTAVGAGTGTGAGAGEPTGPAVTSSTCGSVRQLLASLRSLTFFAASAQTAIR